MFEAMLRGWRAQQTARGLREDTIAPRERLVRRFLAFTNEYPWNWGSSQVEEWTQSLVAERRLAPSTIRGYQTDLRLFSEYLCDGRYGWAAACEGEFGPGAYPVPVCHEWNTIAHLNGYEGRPEARPFTREELQLFLDYADEQVDRAVRAEAQGGAGRLPGRDACSRSSTAGGCAGPRRRRLDVADCGPNPAAPEFGGTGCCTSAMARPSAASRRGAVTCLGDGVGGGGGGRLRGEHPAAVRLRRPSGVVGDRARRAGQAAGDQRPVRGLPGRAGPACRPWWCTRLRHAYVTHLTEDGVDRRFIQEQVGHRVRQLHRHLHQLSGIASDGREAAGRHVRAVLFRAFEASQHGCLIR